MRNRTFLSAMIVIAGLSLLACSDDTKTTDAGKHDKGPKKEGGPVEATIGQEASPGTEGGIVDGGKKGDQSTVVADLFFTEAGTVTCDSTCSATYPFLCTKNGSGKCVECTADVHCTSNQFALGNTCNTTNGYCVCKADGDCTTNAWGHKCDTTNAMCYCKADADCSASTLGSKCDTSKTYQCYCTADADCASSDLGTVCNTTYSVCSCTKTSECSGSKTCTGKYGSVSVCI
jgi:hypothetical protein